MRRFLCDPWLRNFAVVRQRYSSREHRFLLPLCRTRRPWQQSTGCGSAANLKPFLSRSRSANPELCLRSVGARQFRTIATPRFRVRKKLFPVVFLAAVGLAVSWSLSLASAQDSESPPHSHADNQASTQQDNSMAGMNMPMQAQAALQLPSPHEGSGTAWQPASVQGPAWMWMRDGWGLMAHGTVVFD